LQELPDLLPDSFKVTEFPSCLKISKNGYETKKEVRVGKQVSTGYVDREIREYKKKTWAPN
jgi:hypothetical protein